MTTQYFPHDYHARQDPKLIDVHRRLGLAGLGAFWCIVEQLYEQGGSLPLAGLADRLSWELRCEGELIQELLHGFGLFVIDTEADLIRSASVTQRLEIRQEKSEKAVKSARARWSDANAMRTHSERNANAMQSHSTTDANAMLIKERKGKEIKEKENKGLDTKTTKGAGAPAEAFEPTGMDKALLARADVSTAWQAFLAHRRRIKAPCTAYALQLIVKKLRELRGDDGAGWAELLNLAVERGWRSVFEPHTTKTQNHDRRPDTKPTLAERYNERARDLLAGL